MIFLNLSFVEAIARLISGALVLIDSLAKIASVLRTAFLLSLDSVVFVALSCPSVTDPVAISSSALTRTFETRFELNSTESNHRVNANGELGVIVFALVLPTLITALYFVVLASATPAMQLLGYASKFLQFALPIVWVVAIQREKGFRITNGTLKGLAFGLTFGLLISAAMLLLYFSWLKTSVWMNDGLDAIREKVVGLGINSVGKYALLGLFYSLVHSCFEEYYWRWFVFGRLRLRSKMSTAVAVSSLGFMAHHVLVLGYFFGWGNPLTYFLSLSVAVGGAVWATLYHRSDNMLGPWISHLLIDAAIFTVGFDVVRHQMG